MRTPAVKARARGPRLRDGARRSARAIPADRRSRSLRLVPHAEDAATDEVDLRFARSGLGHNFGRRVGSLLHRRLRRGNRRSLDGGMSLGAGIALVTEPLEEVGRGGAVNVRTLIRRRSGARSLRQAYEAYPRTLSFGQKRRLGVAAALALNPQTLILDEITNGQDEQEKNNMMAYLEKLNQEKGITIILITHDMNIARQYTNRALVLHNGDLVFDGATAKLYDGKSELNEWGLTQPIIATLSATFGVEAQNAEEFCEKLHLKEGVVQ